MTKQAYIQLPLFQEDFPVNPFPWPESNVEKRTTDISGPKCSELSESYTRLISSVRMYLESCTLPLTRFVRTWSVRATKSGYLIMKLRLSEQGTGEKGSSLWATPNTMDSLPSRSYEAMKRQATNGGRKNRKRPGNLREQIDPLMCQAYKDASAEANGKMWPTPTRREYKGARTPEALKAAGRTPNNTLGDAVMAANGGQLNPTFVEWLMGFPRDWTEVG